MSGPAYEYVYTGTALFDGRTREFSGSALCPEPCGETKLRAVAVRELSRSENVPAGEIELLHFAHYGMVAGVVDPFAPQDVPEM